MQSTAHAVRRSDRPAEDAARRPRVLLVEDDADMRDLLGTVLRKAGYRVYEGPDGMSLIRCLSVADDSPLFDVIVSDVQMPDFTALEVLEALRMRNLPTPIVLVSAFVDDWIRAESAELRASALLKKPVDGEQLLRAVHDALGTKRAQPDGVSGRRPARPSDERRTRPTDDADGVTS